MRCRSSRLRPLAVAVLALWLCVVCASPAAADNDADSIEREIASPIVSPPPVLLQQKETQSATQESSSPASSSSSSSPASVSVLEVAADAQASSTSKNLLRLKSQTADAAAASAEGLTIASSKEKALAQSVLSRVSQAFLASSLEKIARENDEAEIRRQVEAQDQDWNELTQDDETLISLLEAENDVPNFDFHPSHSHLLPFSHTSTDANEFSSLASSTSPLAAENTLNTNMMQLQEMLRADEQDGGVIAVSADPHLSAVPPGQAVAATSLATADNNNNNNNNNANSLAGFHRDGWVPTRQRVKTRKVVRKVIRRRKAKGKAKTPVGGHNVVGVAPVLPHHKVPAKTSAVHMRLMQTPSWYMSQPKHSTFTASSHAHRPDTIAAEADNTVAAAATPAETPRFAEQLAQTDNQFSLFEKEQNAIKNLAKAKANLATIEAQSQGRAAAKTRRRVVIRKVVRRVVRGKKNGAARSKAAAAPAASVRPAMSDREREKEKWELRLAGQKTADGRPSIHDVSAQYGGSSRGADMPRFMEQRSTAKSGAHAAEELEAGADMRMRQRMFASGGLFTRKAKAHRVELENFVRADAHSPTKASDIEDCTGCKFIWMQVEMDVGGARFVEDVQASFEHNCMDAQKSTIFYGVCEDMYDDMYAMTDDYMANTFPVDAICARAKMCK